MHQQMHWDPPYNTLKTENIILMRMRQQQIEKND